MNDYIILPLLLLLSTVIQLVTSGRCPPAELISPCTCENNNDVYCRSNSKYDLDQVMQQIATTARNDAERTFNNFGLINSKFDKLTSGMFHGVRFKHIILLDNKNLTCVNAFESMETTLITFESIGSNLT